MLNIATPENSEEFKAMVGRIEAGPEYQRPEAFALGLATVEGEGSDATILDVQYTKRNYVGSEGTAAVLAAATGQLEAGLQTGGHLIEPRNLREAFRLFTPFLGEPGHANIDTLEHMDLTGRGINTHTMANRKVPILGVVRKWEDTPATVADLYLRLYALSDRAKLPNTVNIVPGRDFGTLPNVVISEEIGAFSVDRWNELAEELVFKGVSTAVRVLDKFPRMLDHVVPTGVRVADPSRVRLGAHLGEGTTVMHEGFSNFNAGTAGASMVEGRISAGVLVGEGSDIGGGASTQGTMSGGGKEVVSIGQRCLLEANSGIGISLGDDCRVEAGIYVKSTTPVTLPDGNVVKAAKLSGSNNMLLRRNAITGTVEMVPNDGGEWGGLNQALHATN